MSALYGPWDMSQRPARFPYDDTASYELIADYLDSPGTLVEDWGCGGAWLGTKLTEATYRAIDGAAAPWVDEQVDLRVYTSKVPRANMRHVLEHNPDWRTVVANFLASFDDRATLVTWVPFRGEGCVHQPCGQTDAPPGDAAHGDDTWPVPDIHMVRDDLYAAFEAADVIWDSVKLETVSQYGCEEVFYLRKVDG
jgi:hypothetical protein